METKGTKISAEDSDNSDDSMEGERPKFSAEERELPCDLLMDSNDFIQLYEEHKGNLQGIIEHLKQNSEVFIDEYGKITKSNLQGAVASSFGGFSLGVLGVLFAPFTGGVSMVVGGAAGAVLGAAPGAVLSYSANKNKQQQHEKLLEEVKNSLNTFNQTADKISNSLHKICDHLEEIEQYQKGEHPSHLKREAGKRRLYAHALLVLAELFNPEDMHRLLVQGKKTVYMSKSISSGVSALLLFLGVLFVFEDTRTLRDFNKLKKCPYVQEDELESEAGKFICKLIEMTDHMQNTLNEMKKSKIGVESIVIHNINQYFK